MAQTISNEVLSGIIDMMTKSDVTEVRDALLAFAGQLHQEAGDTDNQVGLADTLQSLTELTLRIDQIRSHLMDLRNYEPTVVADRPTINGTSEGETAETLNVRLCVTLEDQVEELFSALEEKGGVAANAVAGMLRQVRDRGDEECSQLVINLDELIRYAQAAKIVLAAQADRFAGEANDR